MHIFDSKRPHGVIYGHPIARYEQNGLYYDGLGRQVMQETMNKTEEEAIIANKAAEEKKAEEAAKAGPKRRGRPPGAKNKEKRVQQ